MLLPYSLKHIMILQTKGILKISVLVVIGNVFLRILSSDMSL